MTDREPPEIEATLRAYARTPIAIREATKGLSEAQALAAPTAGEWSVAQIVAHLWTVDGHALATFAGAEPPTQSVREPHNPASFAALLDAFELRRAASVAALRNLAPELWDTVFSFRGVERTARQLATGFVNHDANHLQQIAATRSAIETTA